MRKIPMLFALGSMVFALFSACNGLLDKPVSGTGRLSLQIVDDVSARNLLVPSLSMTPAKYLVSGSGPDGAAFGPEVITGLSLTKNSLVVGGWTVTVEALNDENTLIGLGTAPVTVVANQTTNAPVSVTPLTGDGSIDLSLSWDVATTTDPVISAVLRPASGDDRILAFTLDTLNGLATFNATDIQAGYYQLILQLTELKRGTVVVVRIVQGETTTGTFDFGQTTHTHGVISVTISPTMRPPLEVEITGSAVSKTTDQSLNLSAMVSNYVDNVTYIWYVNGESQATGAEYTFGTSWAEGTHNVDVVAVSTDLSQAGSAGVTIDVLAGGSANDYTSANIGTLKYVPAGSYQRDVTTSGINVITQPYRIGQYEITRAQFLSIMGTDPSDIAYSNGVNDPVQKVNSYHAIAFCNKLSLAEGLAPVYTVSEVDFSTLVYGDIPTVSDATWMAATADWNANGYRLPTEMEWTWAAMGAPADGQGGGTNTTGYTKAFAGSTGTNSIGDYAWYSINSGTKTQPVGTKYANELGLYDMSGNVAEWCWDWSSTLPLSDTLTDYRGPETGPVRRIVRGGSFFFDESNCTVSARPDYESHTSMIIMGFRVVRL